MGAEREDTDPTAKRNGTEPGLGKGSGATPAAAPGARAPKVEDEAPPPVDFDALHAALGDPLDYVEMGSGPALEKGNEIDDLLEPATEEVPTGPGVRVGESSGRSSATYASARPHTIPPTRAPIEDPNAPAVIVATDTDTVPSAPPQMTVPLAASPHAAQFAGVPGVPGVAPAPHGAPHAPHGPTGSNPHIGSGPHAAAHPGSGPHVASGGLGVSYPHTPQPIPVQRGGVPQMTMRMPDRPVNARRGKTPTIVVRPRGPSTKQRLLAFMAMLLLVTACGIAVIIWRKPKWLGLDTLGGIPPWSGVNGASGGASGPNGAATATTPPVSPSSGALGAPSGSGAAAAGGPMGTSATNGTGPTLTPVGPNGSAGPSSSAAAGAASASASASASAKKGLKVAPPPSTATPHPASSAPPLGHL